MKAVLTFDLSNPEDALEYRRANAVHGALSALYNMQEWLHVEADKETPSDMNAARGTFHDILECSGVDLEELWS